MARNRLKRKWSANEIEIRIVEPEPVPTRLESRFDPLGPMIGVSQLCCNKDVFTRNPSSGESCLQRFTNPMLIPVSFRRSGAKLQAAVANIQAELDEAWRRLAAHRSEHTFASESIHAHKCQYCRADALVSNDGRPICDHCASDLAATRKPVRREESEIKAKAATAT